MKQLIRQDNSITNARYDLDACQLDILFCSLVQVHDDDTADKKYIVYTKEIEEATERKWNYSQLKAATSSMGNRTLEIENDKTYKQFWLFQEVEYIKGEGRIEILFTKQAIVLLKSLKNNFTTYELQSALSMTSKYAKRIYQICSQWKDIGESKRYEIPEFKANMGLIDKDGKEEYQPISMFKARVLDVAVEQINKNSDLKISYKLAADRGKTRPLKFVTFYIKKNVPAIIPIEFRIENEPDVRTQNLALILHELGITNESIVQKITESEDLKKQVFSFSYELKTGKFPDVKNPAGLLLKKLGLV